MIELIAVTRGQPAPRLPAIAPVQALAAALVGATMMTALHVPRAATRSAPPLHAALDLRHQHLRPARARATRPS